MRKGIHLVEVLVCLALLVLGFFPIYSLMHESRVEAGDSEAFVGLLEKVEERATEARTRLAQGDAAASGSVSAAEGDRALAMRIEWVDPVSSFAPKVEAPK